MPESGKTQLVNVALRELRGRILSGEFEPDAHISETAAAELTGISRTPAREALAQLVEEGLLSRSASGRCTVRQFTRDDILDAVELRGVLEGTNLRLAAERGPAAEPLERCQDLMDRIDAALGDRDDEVDFEVYATLNEQFHRELANVSGSETMKRELLRVQRLPFASPTAFPAHLYNVPQVRRSFHRAQDQHRGMIAAVRAGEGTRAEALAREHARLAWDDYQAVMYHGRKALTAVPGFAMIATGDNAPAA